MPCFLHHRWFSLHQTSTERIWMRWILGWLRYGNRMVRYLPKWVLRQFGYVQTVPRYTLEIAHPRQNLGEITLRFQRALDYALTPQELGHPAVYGVEASEGYIHWFYDVFHPRMILPDIEVLVPTPPELEAIDEIAAQEDGEHGYLELSGRLDRIRDLVYAVISSGEVQRGSDAWSHLEEALREVHGGKVYHRKGTTKGGRGVGGSRGGRDGMGGDRGGRGVVIKG